MKPGRLPLRWFDVVLDALAVAGVIAVLAFPAAALVSVSSTAKLADPTVALPRLRLAPVGKVLRDVPVFTSGGDAEAEAKVGRLLTDQTVMLAALDRQSQAVLGASGADQFLTIVGDNSNRLAEPSVGGELAYPFRFPPADQILDATFGAGALPSDAVGAVDDLAGLLVLAAVGSADRLSAFPNAAAVAYALYDRARASDACDPQLNLAFVVSAASPKSVFANTAAGQQYDEALYQATVSEYRRAARDCGEDPTPLWLLGQFQSMSRHPETALVTFAQLERRLPGSALGWSGEADARMRAAYRVDVLERFTAAAHFSRAEALYRRAEKLDPREPGLWAGEARARAGLRHFSGAVNAHNHALKEMPAAERPSFEALLVTYLEQAGRFGAAGDRAVPPRTPLGPPPSARLIAQGTGVNDGVGDADALGPISYGAGRLRPVHLEVSPRPPAIAFTDSVLDISFIPQFRQDGLTSTGNRSRDLVLAGRGAAALDGLDFRDRSSRLLLGVEIYQSGDLNGAIESVAASDASEYAGSSVYPRDEPRLAAILDADQNLWRFAGDLERAARAANEWSRREPADPLGADRAGEIAYLQGHYADAAGFFGKAASRAGRAQPAGSEAVANELLKEGTALEMNGDLAKARAALRRADAAVQSIPAGFNYYTCGGSTTCEDQAQGVLDSYNARLQAGDTELRDHKLGDARFAAAEQHYEAARIREKQLQSPEKPQVDGETRGDIQTLGARRELLFRPEVLENNQALVLVHLHRLPQALSAVERAVASDPKNPYFRANRGYIEGKLGDRAAAIRSYESALAARPVLPWAANNLGVILADRGHPSQAADKFRLALAANSEYPTGEFNLGLVLDRMSPSHVFEAQGELAAATRRDPSLRERDHELVTDDETYITTLDLSKPLPPNWQFSTSEQRTPITVASVVFALLLFRVLKAFVRDKVSDNATEGVLRTYTKRLSAHADRLGSRIPGAVALVAVVAVFAYPLARSSGATRGDFLLLGIGVAVATLAFMRLRSAIARRSAVRTRHSPCIPAVVVGGAAALVGLGFAPMPATRSDDPLPSHARWWGTGFLGALTLVLLIVGRLTAVPFATQLGVVCLVMTSSALVPVEPYDGVLLDEGHRALYVAIALVVVGALLELGVV